MRQPRDMHPAFYGCYDWHSAVHGHWTLVRILRLYPSLPSAAGIRAALNRNLTRDNLAAELAYFRSPGRGTFERPYGWAWLLALAAELRKGKRRRHAPMGVVAPPSREVHRGQLLHPSPAPAVPDQVGACIQIRLSRWRLRWITRGRRGHRRLEKAILSRSRVFFGADANRAGWPGSRAGRDFLSPSLTESDLMARILFTGCVQALVQAKDSFPA